MSRQEEQPVRTVAVLCPDWPVMAAGVAASTPAAVLHANRVVACSPAARDDGIVPGLRRRAAQDRCPDLVLLPHDPERDALAFEPVLAAIERLTPHVEVAGPGVCAFPARGAARWHGGEERLLALVAAEVAAVLGERGDCRVGIADGRFAAGLAAREGVAVPAGGSRAFLAGFGVDDLGRPDLADLLGRLGLRTLGDLAALPPTTMGARFGEDGTRAYRLASGLDLEPPARHRPPPDLTERVELDPPAERADAAAFATRLLATRLCERLDDQGLTCTRLRIELHTEHGEAHARSWRLDAGGWMGAIGSAAGSVAAPAAGAADAAADPDGAGADRGVVPLGAAAIVDRVRWQLDGWLGAARDPHQGRDRDHGGGRGGDRDRGRDRDRDRGRGAGFGGGRGPGGAATLARAEPPTAGVTLVLLVPEEIVPARGRQLGFWGEESGERERAARALARAQGLLGADAVFLARLRGGRDPADRAAPVNLGGAEPTPPAGGGPAGRAGDQTGDSAGEAAARAAYQRSLPGTGPGAGTSAGSAGRGRRKASAEPAPPWPGQVPPPAPATVYAEPVPAELHGSGGEPITVGGRGLLDGQPSRLRVSGHPPATVSAWSAPWPLDERWWDARRHRRVARLQVTTETGEAWLLYLVGGRWWAIGRYD